MKFVGAAALFSDAEKAQSAGNFFLNGKFAEDNTVSAADAVYKRGIYAIADGSRSEAFGGEAAYVAVNTLGDYNERVFFRNYLEYFKESNDGVINQGFLHDGKELAADTAILNVCGGKAKIYSIGNAAVLRIRSGKIERLNDSQKRFVRVKDFVADEFGEMRFKNVEREAAPHFGVSDAVYAIVPFVKKVSVKKGDIFVLIGGETLEKIGNEAILAAVTGGEKSSEQLAKSLADMAGGKNAKSETVVVVKAQPGVSARAAAANTAAVLALAAVLAAGTFVIDKYGSDIVSAAKNTFYEKIMGQKDEEQEKLRELSEESSEASAEKREAERIKRKEEKQKKLEEEQRKAEEKRIAEEQAQREQQEKAAREREEIEKSAMEKAAQIIRQQRSSAGSTSSGSSKTPKKEQQSGQAGQSKAQAEPPKTQTEPPKAQQPSAPQGNVEENNAGSGDVELPIDFGS